MVPPGARHLHVAFLPKDIAGLLQEFSQLQIIHTTAGSTVNGKSAGGVIQYRAMVAKVVQKVIVCDTVIAINSRCAAVTIRPKTVGSSLSASMFRKWPRAPFRGTPTCDFLWRVGAGVLQQNSCMVVGVLELVVVELAAYFVNPNDLMGTSLGATFDGANDWNACSPKRGDSTE